MPIVLAVIGVLLGGSIAEWGGAIFGGVLGFMAGHMLKIKQQLATLVRALDEQKSRDATTQGSLERAVNEEARHRNASSPRPAAAIPKSSSVPHSTQSVESTQAYSTARVVEETAANQHKESSVKPRVMEEFAPLRWLREFFTGGNTVVRVSIAILFVGVALLLQYASERGHFPIEARLIGVVIGAIAFLVLGWRLRNKRPGFAIALQGGATGVLYLTIFAALRAYALLPASLAFILLLAIVVLSAALAILQDALWLALLGISGGFLAPILTSTGQGSHIALFSFYAVLNVGVFAIAWFKAWRPLNVLGFAFTFVIGALWGVQRYAPELFATTEPFLIVFFLMYVSIAVLFAARQLPNLKGYVDGTIVFGTPIAAFALQSAMLYERRYWLSFSALIVSALYVSLAWALWRRRPTWRLLAESFLALSVAFATLAIPLALDGRWSAATWALEGAALLWVGCRQSQLLPRMAGLALQFGAAFMFLRDRDFFFAGTPILNSTCLGALIIAGAGIYSSRLLVTYARTLGAIERSLAGVVFLWGLLWWLMAGLGEIDRIAAYDFEVKIRLVFLAATSLFCSETERRMGIRAARIPALSLLPIMLCFAALEWANGTEPLAQYGWLAWPFACFAFYFTLRRHEPITNERFVTFLHVGGAWLTAVLISRECAWWIDLLVAGAGSWPAIAWAIVPAAALLLSRRFEQWLSWPVARHPTTYAFLVGGSFAAYLLGWSVFTCVARSGDPYPLPYVPLLNPLDLTQAMVLLAGSIWLRRNREMFATSAAQAGVAVIGAVIFIWLNAILLRTIHYWDGVAYLPDELWRSTLVQTALSIFWTVLALATMLFATRRCGRMLWWVGAALMAVVVAKLFFIDLSRIGSIARIISFIGVGLLMLIVGYFSPLPPQQKEHAQ